MPITFNYCSWVKDFFSKQNAWSMVDLNKYLMNEWVHFMLHLRFTLMKGFTANGKNQCTVLLTFAGAERTAQASGGADS